MSRLRDAWNQHWFAPDSARNLAIARILAASTALWVLLSRNRAEVSALPTVFWTGVPDSTRWRFLVFPGHAGIEGALTLLAAILLVGALFGIKPRLTCLLSGLLLYHLAPLESVVWTASPHGRGLTLPALALLACGMSPSADALAPGASAEVARSWRYGWPLRLIQFWLAAVYVFSGISKLRATGFSWGSASNLSHWLRFATQNDFVAVHQALGGWLAAHAVLAGGIGAGTLLFEFGMALAPFSRRLRPWLAGCALLFHLGIYFAMNITLNSWPLLLTFFDWDSRAQPLDSPSPGLVESLRSH